MNLFQIFFLVPKKTGDLRPVINLKPLNQFVQRIHFKMENIQRAMNFVSLGDYMVPLDLKDAYFSVPIFRPHCKYLVLFGETGDISLLVYLLVRVRHLGFLPRSSNLLLHSSD